MRYSIIIRIDKNISIEGNQDILWYIDQITKEKNNIENLLEALKKYKEKFRKKGKMNIIIVGNIDKDIIDKYKEYFNIILQKDIQENIVKYLK